MNDRFVRVLLIVVAVLLAALLVQPYFNRAIFSASTPRPVAARGDLSQFERSTIHVFQSVAPSVVQVVAQPASAQQTGTVQTGTGFIWDDAGHVVTNNHVIANTTTIVVRLASGDVLRATVAGRTPNYDLAVLQLDTRKPLPPPIPLGNAKDLQVGQIAYAIGNPFGLDQSLTMGIISALKRRLPTSGGREISDVIQTDAAINPGNSGGPLLDSSGRLIGVNSAIYSPSGANAGIGFAIPVNVVNRIIPALIRSGRVPTPGIGILVANEAVTAQLGVNGIVIADVVPGSPAAKADLKGIDRTTGTIGDVIVAVNGDPVQHLTDLTDKLEQAGPGGTVALTVERSGKTRQVKMNVIDIGER